MSVLNNELYVRKKTVSMRVTEQLNHFLDIRVLELKAVAESKKGIDKSWLMLRLMELGQDWLAAWHLGQPTDFEIWVEKEIKNIDKQLKKAKGEEKVRLEGVREGLLVSFKLFDQYEKLICEIGGEK